MSMTVLFLLSCTNEGAIQSLVPILGVQPSEIVFPDVGPPLSATLPLYVGNSGQADLAVTFDLESVAFSIDAESVVLAPGATAEVPITFTPPTLLPYDGILHIDSNDADHPSVTVPLTGRGVDLALPDIEVEPARTIEEDDVPVGGSEDFVFQLLNVGEAPLVLGDIGIDAPDVFTVTYAPSGFTLGPGDADNVIVSYAPTATAGEVAFLTVPSNDPDEPTTTILLIGNGGGDFERPVAVIDCPAEVELTGPQWLPLDGSGSFDPAHYEPLTFAWTVVERPPGSDADVPLDPSDTEVVDLYVDLAGTWAVELVVTNALGTTSAPATCTFSSVPADDLHVELSWSVPQADVDLHLVRAGGELFDCTDDCFFSNLHPDWGVAGDPDDDPRLDLDDEVGFGPENINLFAPPDGSYDVNVHVFDLRDDPALTATVHVWLGGLQVWTGSAVLDAPNELWPVGTIDWPSGTFVPTTDPHAVVPPSFCN